MKEKISTLLNKDISRFIIAPFTEAEALSFQFAFLIGFIDYILHGGFEVNLFAKLKDMPSIKYLFEPIAIIWLCLCLGYTIYLLCTVLGAQPLQAKIKYRVAMVMHTLLSIVSIANGVRLLDTELKFNSAYNAYIFGISLYFFIFSIIKFSLLKFTFQSSSWLALTKNDVISKMKDDQISIVHFFAILSSSVLLYIFFRSFNGIAITILQTYLFSILFHKAHKQIR